MLAQAEGNLDKMIIDVPCEVDEEEEDVTYAEEMATQVNQ